MTKQNKLKIGEAELHLRWSKRAEFRLSESGFLGGYDPKRGVAQLFCILAACNENPTTKHLSGEDLYEASPDFDSEEEMGQWFEKLTEAVEKLRAAPGKPKKKRSMNTRSVGSR
tara:strand:+ start:433 stop:774 length:342 start_codon:yes stop_codon:yes gene_type:complete